MTTPSRVQKNHLTVVPCALTIVVMVSSCASSGADGGRTDSNSNVEIRERSLSDCMILLWDFSHSKAQSAGIQKSGTLRFAAWPDGIVIAGTIDGVSRSWQASRVSQELVASLAERLSHEIDLLGFADRRTILLPLPTTNLRLLVRGRVHEFETSLPWRDRVAIPGAEPTSAHRSAFAQIEIEFANFRSRIHDALTIDPSLCAWLMESFIQHEIVSRPRGSASK